MERSGSKGQRRELKWLKVERTAKVGRCDYRGVKTKEMGRMTMKNCKTVVNNQAVNQSMIINLRPKPQSGYEHNVI